MKYMKRYILFGLSFLLAFPLTAVAQDDLDDEEEAEVVARKAAPKQKTYETRIVKGRVVDAVTQQPIAGAIVRAAEITGFSVLTEDDGTYEIKVPLFTSSLFITSPDYNPVKIGLQADERQKTASLYSANFDAEYQAQTNSLSNYAASDFQYTNALNIKDEIQKQLGAQVYTTARSGMPGIGSVMFVQGLNSLNVNAQPLIVIDGVIVEQQYGRTLLHDGFYNDILNNVNPADIAKVTVMRNGTALYGAKGANGVILIETHRSQSMATRITATASAGVVLEPKYYSVLDGDQYRGYASELLGSTGTTSTEFKFLNENPTYYYYKHYHNNTDWKEQVYKTAVTQNYGVNVEGGDNVANYNLSVNYTMAKSPLKYNDMDRLNIRFNTDIALLSKLDVRFDASFSNQTRNIRNDGAPESYDEGTTTSPSFLAYVKSPFMSPYNYAHPDRYTSYITDHLDIDEESYLTEALAYYRNYNWKLANPVALNEYADAPNKNRFENSMLNLAVKPKFKFNDHLSLSEHFSYNLVNTNEKYYIPINGVPRYYVSSVNNKVDNEVRSLFSKQNSVMSDTRLDWTNRHDAHNLHVFGGVRINWENYTLNSQLGYNTGSDKTPYISNNNAYLQLQGANDSWNSMAMYAQAEYDYKNRYYLQANLTGESSSRFGKNASGLKLFGVAWGIFPAVQASWVLTNEPWMANVSGIDYLRLTAGYDISGNDDIDYFAARTYFRASQFLAAISSLSIDGIGNTSIQWETTRRLNAGIEGNFFNNRLSMSLNYFRSNTDNLLNYQALSFLTGLDKNWTNGGKLQNEGFDVTANVKVLALKEWQWQVGASVGHYKNKIKELADNATYLEQDIYGGTIRTEIGQPANLFYGYKTQGVFATTEEANEAGLYILGDNGVTRTYFGAGDMHFVDVDGNGEINKDDRVVIGDPNPDIYGNIFTSLAWKHFKLDVRFNYSLGNDVYNYMRSQLESGSRFMNQTTAMTNRWQKEGQQTDMPKVAFQDPMGNARFSDRWIEDGSYLRLKTVTLSYDLPLNSEFIQGLRFWIQGNNLLTFTKYLGTDPEFTMTSNVIGQGIDLGRVGQSRSIVAGVKINL